MTDAHTASETGSVLQLKESTAYLVHEIGGALLCRRGDAAGDRPGTGVGTTEGRPPASVLVAAMRAARPDVTLQEMCNMLEEMLKPTPRGRATWYPSSVKALLDRAERLGIAPQGASATSLGGSDQVGTRSVAGG